MVAVTGPAGIGKTRLVGELRRRTERRAIWFVGRAVPATSSMPLATVREALHALEGTQRDLLDVLAERAAERPVVLWIDDLHVADPGTSELVNHVGRNPVPAALLVLVTLRQEELIASADLALNVGSLIKDGLAAEVRLTALNLAEMDRLAEHMLGRPVVTEELLRWISDRTRGNPLMLTAILEDLADDPARRSPAGTIQERTRAILATLPAAAQRAAEAAAVLGGSFSAPELMALEPMADEGLDRLVAAGVLVEDEALRLDFAHPIVQEAVYSTTGPARRAHLHRRAADSLPLQPALRAYHLARGAQPGDAVAIDALRAAASDAFRAGSPKVAAARLQDALNLTPGADSQMRHQLLDELAGAADAAGDHTAGVPALRELLRLAAHRSEEVAARLRLASFLSAGEGDLAEAEEHVGKAVAICRTEVPEKLGAALNELAWLRGEAGDLEGQVRFSREALALAAHGGTDQLHALGPLTHALLLPGMEDEAEAASAHATDLAGRLADRSQQDWHISVRSDALAARGDVAGAVTLLEPLASAGRQTADVVQSTLVRHLWLNGRWDEAMTVVRQLLDTAPSRVPVRTAWALAIGGAIEAGSGRPESAKRLIALTQRAYAGRDFYCFSAWNDWGIGVAESLVGNAEAGLEHLQASAARLEAMGAITSLAMVLPDLCEVALAIGDRDRAAMAAKRSAALAESTHLRLANVGAAACAGFMSRKHLSGAAAMARDAGLELLAARLLACGAISEVAEATRMFAAMRAPELERRCQESLRAFGAPGRRAARDAGTLTKREEEVAELARRGLSTPAIAAQLGVSERTVESHLARVYSKLVIGGRHQLKVR